MDEDRIERNHQVQMRDGSRFSRSRNKKMIMNMQAKAANIRVKQSVKEITTSVEVKASRKK